jgi:hypothetical protein
MWLDSRQLIKLGWEEEGARQRTATVDFSTAALKPSASESVSPLCTSLGLFWPHFSLITHPSPLLLIGNSWPLGYIYTLKNVYKKKYSSVDVVSDE